MEKKDLPKALKKYRRLLEKAARPFIRLLGQPCEYEEIPLWQSKIGGYPYLPVGFDYPLDSNGRHMLPLAQINFEELPPLPDPDLPLPKKGLLQFYVALSEENGDDVNADDPAVQKNFRLIYFESVDRENCQRNFDFLEDVFTDEQSPVSCQLKLSFAPDQAPPNTSCIEYTRLVEQGLMDVCDSDDSDLWEEYQAFCKVGGQQIGGYPRFEQADPREDPRYEDYRLLLQIDYDEELGLMLGSDLGVGNFFILTEDLKNLRFDRVLYEWAHG